MNIIGRKKEISELLHYKNSKKSEFVALYGRRRVGKTVLVKELFKGEFAFSHTGLSPYDEKRKVTRADQLEHFYHSLIEYGLEETSCPENWLQAFYMLEHLLQEKNDGGKQLVFIDELPWMDANASGFVTAIEAFWNGWASDKNIYLIVCGSATSWMLDNVINNTGGLYGRLSAELHLSPFTLCETEAFFESNGIAYSHYDIAQAYMVLGGIPYYLEKFRKGRSLAQNIDNILFSKQATLSGEFNRLIGSLFTNPEPYTSVIRLLSKRRYGYTREEISVHTGISSGSGLTKIIRALEAGEFIVRYVPFDAQKREVLYRLTDPFCQTYLKLVDGRKSNDPNYWQNSQNLPTMSAWRGIAFEELCMAHLPQIKNALGISGIETSVTTLTLRGDETSRGTQVDLFIIRKDNVVNLCEIKFSNDEFEIDKAYDAVLRHRISAVSERLKKTQNIHLTFITTFGIKQNEYSGIVQREITLDALFG